MKEVTIYYYIEKDNEIKLFDTDETRLRTTLIFMPELQGLEVKSTTDVTLFKPLKDFKKEKLQELDQKSSAFEQTENKEMYVVSSLGFKVNADPKALRNIDVLISQKVTQFKVYDNTIKPVTVEDLKIIKSEIEQNALNLYHQKWGYEDMVNNAGSIEELNQIDINFKMLDFNEVVEETDDTEVADEILS